MPREVRKRRRDEAEEEEDDEGQVVISSDEGEARDRRDRGHDGASPISSREDEEDVDDDGEEEGEERRRSSSKRKKSKKSKKKKKKKKKHKHHRRHRDEEEEDGEELDDEDGPVRKRRRRHDRSRSKSRSRSEREEGEDDASTDREGGLTPELPPIPDSLDLEKPQRISAGVQQDYDQDESGRDSRSDGRKRRRHLDEEDVRDERMSRTPRSPRSRSPRREDRDRDRDRRRRRDEESRFRRSRRSRTKSASRSPRRDERDVKDEEPPKDEPGDSATDKGGGAALSLSIEETNKLRASLGLKPLKVEGQTGGDKDAEEAKRKAEDHARAMGGTLIPNSKDNEVHIPADNWSEKTQADKIREKIKQRRLKREQEARLMMLKKLGEDDSDDEGGGAADWVRKHHEVQKAKKEAEKRAKMLEELDDEFGVGSIVEEDSKKDKAHAYSRDALSGLTVEHDASHFKDGQSVILTLKDSDVLDEDASDTLVNVNMADDDKTRKKLDDAKKARVGYNAYDMEEVDDLTGELKRKNMLDKYDEEIDGEVKKSFTIGRDGKYSAEEEMERERRKIKERLQKMRSRTLESLETPAVKIASDYMTREEAEAKFKKPKKKKKKAKKAVLKADDLLDGAEESFGSRNKKRKSEEEETGGLRAVGGLDDEEQDFGLNIRPEIKVEEDDDDDLASALQKARRVKLALAARQDQPEVGDLAAERIMMEVKREEDIKMEDDAIATTAGSEFIPTFEDESRNAAIILNETAEFCRNLGSRQLSYEMERSQRAKRDEADEVDEDLLSFENSLKTSATRQHEESRGRWEEVDDDEGGEADMDVDSDSEERGGWSTVAADSSSQPSTSRGGRTAILEEEPDLQQGVAAAIMVANRKGYFEKKETKSTGQGLKHLQAKNYTIDDKARGDEGGDRRRERYGGSTQPFQDKAGWKPNVKLEYVDDNGRLMSSKEAFRYLSHKFHGKGSGKMKSEKRMKKVMEEALVKNMLSTDTPLQTLEKLKKKQADSATPYLVLTGNKMNPQDLKK